MHERLPSIQNLVKRFGDFVAVDHVSLQVQTGEIFGFLGPNGAGKSTTIRMLCGLLAPTSGSAVGQRLRRRRRNPSRSSASIGYMSQKFSLYDDLTVDENIDFFAGIYGVPRRTPRGRARTTCCGMAGLAGRRGNHDPRCSPAAGSSASRWAAPSSTSRPILFLDEPTSGVDPIARRAFWDLIYELSAAGHTVFVTTHYMDEAEYCHRLALMYRGRVIALGAPPSSSSSLARPYPAAPGNLRPARARCAPSKAEPGISRRRRLRRRAARHRR